MRPELLPTLLLCLLAGCSSLPATRERAPDPAAASAIIEATQLNSHLVALLAVTAGTPTEQAEAVAAARQAFEQASQGPAALRLGLLLAAPGHPARDPLLAQQLLREAVARPELLGSSERTLAQVELERVSAELRLATENQRLASELQLERERPRSTPAPAAQTRQLQTLQEDNARLRRDLDEARAKLDAIAEIERRQGARPPANEGRNP